MHPLERELHNRFEFLAGCFTALSVNGIEGDYLEFGSGAGKSIWAAWKASRQLGLSTRLWAFDSFAGLPESMDVGDNSHPAWVPGRFAVTEAEFRSICTSMGIPETDLRLVPGWFSESLRQTESLPGKVAFAYVDCDLYSSTKDVLRYLRHTLVPGSILAFDDWFCWSPEGVSGEYRAFEEFRSEASELTFFPYRSIGWHGFSFYCFRNKPDGEHSE